MSSCDGVCLQQAVGWACGTQAWTARGAGKWRCHLTVIICIISSLAELPYDPLSVYHKILSSYINFGARIHEVLNIQSFIDFQAAGTSWKTAGVYLKNMYLNHLFLLIPQNTGRKSNAQKQLGLAVLSWCSALCQRGENGDQNSTEEDKLKNMVCMG